MAQVGINNAAATKNNNTETIPRIITTSKTIDKRKVWRGTLSVLLEQYTAYSGSVSAMEILFSSGNPTKWSGWTLDC